MPGVTLWAKTANGADKYFAVNDGTASSRKIGRTLSRVEQGIPASATDKEVTHRPGFSSRAIAFLQRESGES